MENHDKKSFFWRITHPLHAIDDMLPQRKLNEDEQVIYTYESRGLTRGRTPHDLKAVTQHRIQRTIIITGAGWLLFALLLIVSDDGTQNTAYTIMWSITQMMFAFSLLDKFIYDFIGLLTGLDNIRSDLSESRWDLVILTGVSVRKIVNAKYAVVQIKAWRTMLWVVCLRLCVVMLTLLNLFFIPIIVPAIDSRLDIIETDSVTDVLAVIMVWISIAIVMLMYIVEPRWRLRALAAASLLNSTRSNDTAIGMMWSLLSFFQIWIAQISNVVVLVFSLQFIFGVIGPFFNMDGNLAMLFFGLAIIFYALLIFAMIYAMYMIFANRRLERVQKRLIKLGGFY